MVVSKQGSCFIYQYILDNQNVLVRRTNEIECSIGSGANNNPSPPAGKLIHYQAHGWTTHESLAMQCNT